MSIRPAQNRAHLGDRAFVQQLVLWAWLARFAIVLVFNATDAISLLRLSPDSERYHRVGIQIMHEYQSGIVNWGNWFDNGWFQFTGLVYYLIGPYPIHIQLINISLSALTIVPVFLIARHVTRDVRAQRLAALCAAFFPSFVYWSCLMLKDPASILALALIIYGIISLRRHFTWSSLALVCVGLGIYLGTRAYIYFVVTLLIPIALFSYPVRLGANAPKLAALAIVFSLLPYLLGFGVLGLDFIASSYYFDLTYINRVRVAMGDHGRAALFDYEAVHVWGENIISDIRAAGLTVLSVFAPVNPLDLKSLRQAIAAPLVIFMLYLMIPMSRGGWTLWCERRLAFPVLLFTAAVLAVYVSATTNTGALFRWTTQIMPYFLIMASIGIFQRQNSLLAKHALALVRRWS